MTELELYRPTPAVVSPTVDLDEWAQQMMSAGQIGKALTGTEFVPKSLRKSEPAATTAAVAAAVLTGREVGLSPMSALRSIDVIDGTPALRVVALRALVLRAGHDIWVEESTNTRAIVCGVRRGSTHEQRSMWTMDQAKAANLVNKQNWQRYPAAMLVARATGDVARLIAPDVLLGLPYTVEELADGPIDGSESPEIGAPAKPPAKRTAQRKTAKAVTPAAPPPAAEANSEPRVQPIDEPPPFDEDTTDVADEVPQDEAPDDVDQDQPDDADEVPAIELATEGMVRQVAKALVRANITTPVRQREAVQKIIGRPVERMNQLYRAEVRAVIDELTRVAGILEQQPTLGGEQ